MEKLLLEEENTKIQRKINQKFLGEIEGKIILMGWKNDILKS